MPAQPQSVWGRMSPELQTQILADLSATLQEVIDDNLRTNYVRSPDPQSLDLHSPVYTPSGADQPGKPADAICTPAASTGPGMAP